jgi:hypothetical protein
MDVRISRGYNLGCNYRDVAGRKFPLFEDVGFTPAARLFSITAVPPTLILRSPSGIARFKVIKISADLDGAQSWCLRT